MRYVSRESAALGYAHLGRMQFGQWIVPDPSEGGGTIGRPATVKGSPFMQSPPPIQLRNFEIPISLTLKVYKRKR